MNDIKQNSNRSEIPIGEKRDIRPVVNGGTTKVKKKNGLYGLTDTLISEDARNVKSFVVQDVLVPAIKNTIVDIVTNAVTMIFGGGAAHTKGGYSASKISYGGYYEQRNRSNYQPEYARSRFDHDDIIFQTRGDAEAMLDEMCHVIERYGVVRVSDMYDMAQLTQPFTSEKYGWSNLRSAGVDRVRDGYVLRLPKAMPLD
jgi:hypothetical protein